LKRCNPAVDGKPMAVCIHARHVPRVGTGAQEVPEWANLRADAEAAELASRGLQASRPHGGCTASMFPRSPPGTSAFVKLSTYPRCRLCGRRIVPRPVHVGCNRARSIVRRTVGVAFIRKDPAFTGCSVGGQPAGSGDRAPGHHHTPMEVHTLTSPGMSAEVDFDRSLPPHPAGHARPHRYGAVEDLRRRGRGGDARLGDQVDRSRPSCRRVPQGTHTPCRARRGSRSRSIESG
jgi:hypothetical protein